MKRWVRHGKPASTGLGVAFGPGSNFGPHFRPFTSRLQRLPRCNRMTDGARAGIPWTESIASAISFDHPNGTWLSLVERCVRDAEAAGSNPVVPTNTINTFQPVNPWPADSFSVCLSIVVLLSFKNLKSWAGAPPKVGRWRPGTRLAAPGSWSPKHGPSRRSFLTSCAGPRF